MKLNLNDSVAFSLPIEGSKEGVIFTSVGTIIKISPTHVTLKVSNVTKFPYTPSKLPEINRPDISNSNAVKITTFKIAILCIRKLVDIKKTSPALVEGITSSNGEQMFTMWSDADQDYVFRGLVFDFRGLSIHADPMIIAKCDKVISERLEFEGGKVTVEPLSNKDPVNAMILKQCPNAVLLSSTNLSYQVPVSCESWKTPDFQKYICDEIRRDFIRIGLKNFTSIKAVYHSGEGYYGFTNEEVYIDSRAFLGTVYYDMEVENFFIASSIEEIRLNEDNDQYARSPVIKIGHSIFTGEGVEVSDSKVNTGFYNMSLAVNNLITLMLHGLSHPLFDGSAFRALTLMKTADYQETGVETLAEFFLDPLAKEDRIYKLRQKYLFWLSK